MDQSNQGGKRVAAGGGMPRGAKIALITAAALLVLAVGAYAGLCAWVASGQRVYPNVNVLGADVSGMSVEQARQAVLGRLSQSMQGRTFTLTDSASGRSAELSTDVVEPADLDRTLASLVSGGSFFTQGFQYLHHLASPVAVSPALAFSQEGEAQLMEAVSSLSADLSRPMEETVWTVDDAALVFTKGVTGMAVNEQVLRERILSAAATPEQGLEIPVSLTEAAPPEPDFEAIHREIYQEPADAYLDAETKEVVPSVNGVSFDIAQARQKLEQTAEGADCRIPLTITPPDLTTEELNEKLFADVLSQTKSKCAGPSERWYNIKLAASFVNGTILLPGEEFSYTGLCGPYSESNGYKKAGAYVQGKTVDTTAGGICQLSSTLYWATLEANLETVERAQHRYNTGYLPIVGTDATVYGDSPDFRFKNDTDFPVKIEAYMDDSHWLHVIIYGTNTTGITGDPYSVTLQSIPGEIVYEANADKVPVGGEPVKDKERTLYNGMKVEVHQRLRDKDGNVISDTVIHTDTYKSRDGVYFYNPADAARLGIDPATGKRNLTPVTPTPSPDVSPSPDVTASPAPSGEPGAAETPAPTVPADPSVPTAAPSEAPAPEPTAAVPEPTPIPVPTDGIMPPPEAVEATPAPAPTPEAAGQEDSAA